MIATQTSTHSESADLANVIKLLWGFIPGAAVMRASRAGLFDALSDGPLTIEAICHKLKWAQRSAHVLLSVLVDADLVVSEAGHFRLSRNGEKWLGKGSPQDLRPFFARIDALKSAFEHLDLALERDEPVPEMVVETQKAFGGDVANSRDFALTMRAIDLEIGPSIVETLSSLLPTNRPIDILDVGCGPATLDCLVCESFPMARVVAFDLPGVAHFAQELVCEAGRQADIHVIPTSWQQWDWSSGRYDLVLLSQVLHEATPEGAEILFRNASSALADDGLLVVVIVGDCTVPGGDTLHRLFSLAMLVETGGANPSDEWLAQIEADSSLRRLVFKPIPGGRTLWIGRRSQASASAP